MTKMTKRQAWEMNDRLRSEVTGILVDAAIVNDVSGFIQQSVTFAYRNGGEGARARPAAVRSPDGRE